MNLELLVSECEEMVRAAAVTKVRAKLSSLNTARVPRSLRLRFANLCRRTDMLNIGIKLLSPVARPNRGPWKKDATAQELSEYAVLLQKSGAVREALWILTQIDPVQAPESLLFRSFCHFNRWEYEEAVPLLWKYAELEQRPYQNMVGRVNLAASLVSIHDPQAMDVLQDCLERAKESKLGRLQANCLELRAQMHFHSGRWSEAKADLQTASELAAENSGLDQFLIRKWQAIFTSFEAKRPDALLEFREQAVKRRQWESVREADRFLLKIEFSNERFERLRFGTPFKRYREQLERDYPHAELNHFIMLGQPKDLVLDLTRGEFVGGRQVEQPSRKCHELISVLMSDFYKPFALSALFSELFPGDYFDLASSSHRVRQIVYRTRCWIEKNNLGLNIEESAGRYRLRLADDLAILVPFSFGALSAESLRLDRLRERFGASKFSTRQVRSTLDLSASCCKSLLNWAVTNGHVNRLGSGRATVYRFKAAA